MGIFKACDVRGIYGEDLTEEIVYRIGRALGTMLAGNSVITGGDVRSSTTALKAELSRGLVESGAEVLDIGIVPTPVFYFARHHLGVEPGVMVTASHNPPEFNGLKIVLGPLPITEDELTAVEDLANSGKFRNGCGSVRTLAIIPSYQSFIHSIARVEQGAHLHKVVVDCGNGCNSGLAPDLFRRFGFHIEELYCTPDGIFPNRNPNSADPENLVELIRTVRSSKADVGVAFDGDGDRVAFVDDRGRFLNSDKAIVILARHLLSENPGERVVYDLKCSSVVPESIETAGGTAIPERSGHTFIKTRMIAEDALFGGEISGHYFHRKLGGGDDGIYSALLMANMLVSTGSRLSDLADAIRAYENTPDIRVPYAGNREGVIERLASAFPADRVSRLDGVKITFKGGWALARPSVTEPVITLRFEAETRSRLDEIIGDFLRPAPELEQHVRRPWAMERSED